MWILFVIIPTVLGYKYNEVSRNCIASNYKPLPNDFLLGKWYMIYQFGGSVAETEYCATMEFSKPTAKHLQAYRKKYNVTGMPFNFDENPVVLKEKLMKGLIMGDKEVKYYVLDPEEVMVIREMFDLYAYKRISDKYMVYYHCAMRGHELWLLSRDRNPPLNETDALINTTPIFAHKIVGRYCVDERKSYPLVSGGRYCHVTVVHCDL